jgi:arsenate reductase (thioredoxin)
MLLHIIILLQFSLIFLPKIALEFNSHVTRAEYPDCWMIYYCREARKNSMMPKEEVKLMKKGVLFVCIGNSCRSIMAEALARYHLPDEVAAFSAGTYPLGHITAHTLDVLKEWNIPTDGLYSKAVSAIAVNQIQLVVSLNGDSLDHFLPQTFSGTVIRWYVHDPYGEGLTVFRQTLGTIDWLIREKLPEWLASDNPLMRK